MKFLFVNIPTDANTYEWFERIEGLVLHQGVDFCDTDPEGNYVVIATPDADRVKADLENEGFEL